jgi:hypothetical protein
MVIDGHQSSENVDRFSLSGAWVTPGSARMDDYVAVNVFVTVSSFWFMIGLCRVLLGVG